MTGLAGRLGVRRLGLLGCVTLAMIHSGAMAADTEGTFFGQEARGKWIIGVKGGAVQSGETDFDDADTAGLVLGYEFARPVGFDGKASFEIEVLRTTDDGTIGPSSDFGRPGAWDVNMVGVFFAYRTPGMVYFKAKLGGLQSDRTAKFTGSKVSNDDTSLAFGAGFGLKLKDIAKIELEYTGDTGDNEIDMITLGGMLLF